MEWQFKQAKACLATRRKISQDLFLAYTRISFHCVRVEGSTCQGRGGGGQGTLLRARKSATESEAQSVGTANTLKMHDRQAERRGLRESLRHSPELPELKRDMTAEQRDAMREGKYHAVLRKACEAAWAP